jgi:hypothetical protein
MRVGTLLACLVVFQLSAAETVFTTPPSLIRDGGKFRITFAVASPTDVEVAIVAADGKVLRHLAAGVLGGKGAPPEPFKPGLAQTLE